VRPLLPMALIAAIATPHFVVDARNRSRADGYATKRICDVHVPTGSRLGAIRRCRTQREREEAKQEARQVVDRVQNLKVTVCDIHIPC
jgi:hypothetical protein